MREVANRLERLSCINRDIRLAVTMLGPQCDRLLTLRADFGFECTQLLNQLTAKLAINEHAWVASRILDTFVSMQQMLTGHQARWSARNVEADPDGFIAASAEVHAKVINFLETALEAIDEVTIQAGRRRHDSKAIAHGEPVRLTGTG
jgi:hypothetical protein